MIVIMLNMITMALEFQNMPKLMEQVLGIINTVFVVIFTMECVMKLIGLRIYYFKQPWNIFDFAVVIFALISAYIILIDWLTG